MAQVTQRKAHNVDRSVRYCGRMQKTVMVTKLLNLFMAAFTQQDYPLTSVSREVSSHDRRCREAYITC